MKNHFSKLALMATIALAIAFTLGCEEKVAKPAEQAVTAPKEEASCKDGEKVKLLESINDAKFEYDDKNRIVKIGGGSTSTITYNTDDLITMETDYDNNSKDVEKFVRKGNTIYVESKYPDTLTIDKDGYIVKTKTEHSSGTYQYENGNLIKEGPVGAGPEGDIFRKYEFDDKKSAFSNTNTPKWLIQRIGQRRGFNYVDASKNNATGCYYEPEQEGMPCEGYSYEYDSDGFPTQKLTSSDSEESTPAINYTYRTDCKGGAK